MSRVLEALRRNARATPERIAIEDGRRSLSYARLLACVDSLATQLVRQVPEGRPVALLADNGAAWVIADLAALAARIPLVPLPLFFSPAQMAHALRVSGAGYLMSDGALPTAALPGGSDGRLVELVDGVAGLRLDAGCDAAPLCAGTTKVTFTSGTTGEPKGVCLGSEEVERVAALLCEASVASGDDRHLCVLPLATLLENIGGVYAPLLAGATICAPSLAALGMNGSSGLDVARFVAALHGWRPTSAIVVPQILQALVEALRAGLQAPRSLRHLAVGGAPVSVATLQAAQALGLPVFEGYGLSACASVVALNRPGDNRPGSVGKPLDATAVTIAADGEIRVTVDAWRGYAGELAQPLRAHAIATGDLGRFDDDGYLHLTGRRKNVFITAFGRNVAPEWVERELVACAPILQAALFGDARPFNAAVIVARAAATDGAIERALAAANATLPDYARVRAWIRARAPFTAENAMATPNGRLRRAQIHGAYAGELAALYTEEGRRTG